MNKRQKKKLRKKLKQKNHLQDFESKLTDCTSFTLIVVLSSDTLLDRKKLDKIFGIENQNTSYAVIAKSLKSQRFKGNRRKRILLRRRK